MKIPYGSDDRSDKSLDEGFTNLWELYGLRSNPFDTSPLLVQGGILPLNSFCGREEELTRLFKQFRSSGGSRILIVGDVGVGKTTFVNVARHKAIESGKFFSPLKEIKTLKTWTSFEFVLNTIYAIYATLNLRKDRNELLSDELFEKIKRLVELSSIEKKVTGVSGGLLAISAGVNFDIDKKDANVISDSALHEFLELVVREIYEKSGKETIFHYNNLENLPEKTIREVFEDLRDFFQTPHAHFVFVGNLTVHSIFQSIPRFASIVSDTPILMKELSEDEIGQIIDRRLETLRIEELRGIKPFDKSALHILYELYTGNIRYILNSLTTAIVECTNEKPILLNSDSIGKVLKELVEKRYLHELPNNPRRILEQMVEYDEITNRHISALTKIARSNVSTYLRDLENEGCIYLRRKDGKDKYWSVDPKIKWIKFKANPDLNQKRLEEYGL